MFLMRFLVLLLLSSVVVSCGSGGSGGSSGGSDCPGRAVGANVVNASSGEFGAANICFAPGVNLSGYSSVDFDGIINKGALKGVDLTGANFTNVSVNFDGLDLSGVKFKGVDLSKTTFKNSVGFGVDFKNATGISDVSDANFEAAIALDGKRCKVSPGNFFCDGDITAGVDVDKITVTFIHPAETVNLSDIVDFTKYDFSGAIVDMGGNYKIDLGGKLFKQSTTYADGLAPSTNTIVKNNVAIAFKVLTDKKYAVYLDGASLINVNLSGQGIYFPSHSRFNDVDFSSANLTGIRFGKNVSFVGANFNNAILNDTAFGADSNLDKATLKGAIGNSKTYFTGIVGSPELDENKLSGVIISDGSRCSVDANGGCQKLVIFKCGFGEIEAHVGLNKYCISDADDFYTIINSEASLSNVIVYRRGVSSITLSSLAYPRNFVYNETLNNASVDLFKALSKIGLNLTLDGANFGNLHFGGVNFASSNFSFKRANFAHGDLSNVHFLSSDLRGAIFDSANLNNGTRFVFGSKPALASFKGANISNVSFSGNLSRTNFDDANLDNVSFNGVNLSGSTFKDSKAQSLIIDNAVYSHGVDFSNMVMLGVSIGQNVDLSSSNFSGATLKSISAGSGFDISNSSFSSATLKNINAGSGFDISNSNFSGAIVSDIRGGSNSNMSKANFNGAQLGTENGSGGFNFSDHLDASGASFANAHLNNVSFGENSNLLGVNFTASVLNVTKFNFGTDITDTIFNGTIGDDTVNFKGVVGIPNLADNRLNGSLTSNGTSCSVADNETGCSSIIVAPIKVDCSNIQVKLLSRIKNEYCIGNYKDLIAAINKGAHFIGGSVDTTVVPSKIQLSAQHDQSDFTSNVFLVNQLQQIFKFLYDAGVVLDLTHAKFSHLNLSGVSFVNGSNIAEADFSYANLRGASFGNGSHIAKADFSYANLRGASFGNSILANLANFTGANMVGASFGSAHLNDLHEAIFINATLNSTVFGNSSLDKAIFYGAVGNDTTDFTGITGYPNIVGNKLKDSKIYNGSTCADADNDGWCDKVTDFYCYSRFLSFLSTSKDVACVNDLQSLRVAVQRGFNFVGAKVFLGDTYFRFNYFSNKYSQIDFANDPDLRDGFPEMMRAISNSGKHIAVNALESANLSGLNLSNINFRADSLVPFSNSNFSNSNLAGSTFNNNIGLVGSDFTGANLNGTVFDANNIDKAIFRGAIGNGTTNFTRVTGSPDITGNNLDGSIMSNGRVCVPDSNNNNKCSEIIAYSCTAAPGTQVSVETTSNSNFCIGNSADLNDAIAKGANFTGATVNANGVYIVNFAGLDFVSDAKLKAQTRSLFKVLSKVYVAINLTGANLKGVDLSTIAFQGGSVFTNTNLSFASLFGDPFGGNINFTGANLSNASLVVVDFGQNNDLSSVNFTNANVSGAVFGANTRVDNAIFNGTVGDSSTDFTGVTGTPNIDGNKLNGVKKANGQPCATGVTNIGGCDAI